MPKHWSAFTLNVLAANPSDVSFIIIFLRLFRGPIYFIDIGGSSSGMPWTWPVAVALVGVPNWVATSELALAKTRKAAKKRVPPPSLLRSRLARKSAGSQVRLGLTTFLSYLTRT